MNKAPYYHCCFTFFLVNLLPAIVVVQVLLFPLLNMVCKSNAFALLFTEELPLLGGTSTHPTQTHITTISSKKEKEFLCRVAVASATNPFIHLKPGSNPPHLNLLHSHLFCLFDIGIL